ncbi:MAG: glycosyltransferase family 1 protein [Bacteroidaceae bacterium]
MKILLLGEYSNVHATLADGLRLLGHKVMVMSNGDFWKDYPRDVDLSRHEGKWGGISLMARLAFLLPRMVGYDVVQLINPMFVELKAGRILPLYRFLRRHNRRVVLGAMGMDYYWVHECCTRRHLRYSDFNIGDELRSNADALSERHDWIGTSKERLNRIIAEDCDAIVAGLYEYWTCYQPLFPDKTEFIPLPIKPKFSDEAVVDRRDPRQPVRIFVGVNRSRNEYKGTDIMLRAARIVQGRYPGRMELVVAENVPFGQYVQMMDGSDAIMDQLYSYTPSMNPLEAMSRGLVCIGGGEPESYDILGERHLCPIINVTPSIESVCQVLETLVLHPERIPELKRQSMEYVRKHHDFVKVAQRYEQLYLALLK